MCPYNLKSSNQVAHSPRLVSRINGQFHEIWQVYVQRILEGSVFFMFVSWCVCCWCFLGFLGVFLTFLSFLVFVGVWSCAWIWSVDQRELEPLFIFILPTVATQHSGLAESSTIEKTLPCLISRTLYILWQMSQLVADRYLQATQELLARKLVPFAHTCTSTVSWIVT